MVQNVIHVSSGYNSWHSIFTHLFGSFFYSGMLLLYGRGVSYTEYRMQFLFCERMFVMSYTEINFWRLLFHHLAIEP